MGIGVGVVADTWHMDAVHGQRTHTRRTARLVACQAVGLT